LPEVELAAFDARDLPGRLRALAAPGLLPGREVRLEVLGFVVPLDRPLRLPVRFFELLCVLDRAAMMDDAGRTHPQTPNTNLFG
jgi:hypothetical protein